MKLYNVKKSVLAVFIVFCSICIPVLADVSPDAKLEYNKGIELYQTGYYEQAAQSFKRATELDPNYIDAYFNLGSLLEYLHKDDDALDAFKQIILRKPDDYESVYKAAELSKKLGNYDKAKMYLTLIPTDSLIGQRAKALADSITAVQNTATQNNPASGTVQTTQINPQLDTNGIYNDIASPTGVVTDERGNLYVASFADNSIYKISPDNKKVLYIKDPKIDGPIGMARDKSGNLYVANYNKNNVLKIDTSGTATELISNVKNPYCLYLTGDLLFISSQGNNLVLRYKLH